MAEKKPDGQVAGYERIVNGKVVRVNGYAKDKTSPASSVQARALAMPGRPRYAAQQGTYASGRQLPGVEVPPKPKGPQIGSQQPGQNIPPNQPPGTQPQGPPVGGPS